MTDIEGILQEREKVHGDFWKTADIAQELKAVIVRHTEDQRDTIYDEGIDMICSKLARIVSGDPDHVDHWVDISGYAQLCAGFAKAKADA